jgi:hypothetical protein
MTAVLNIIAIVILEKGRKSEVRRDNIAMYLSIAITEIIKHVVRPLNINMNEIKSHIGCPPTHCNLLI